MLMPPFFGGVIDPFWVEIEKYFTTKTTFMQKNFHFF